jgi:hypothetical protein
MLIYKFVNENLTTPIQPSIYEHHDLQFKIDVIFTSKDKFCLQKESNNEKTARNLLQGFYICPHVIAMCRTYAKNVMKKL